LIWFGFLEAEQWGTWELESSPAWYEKLHCQDYKTWQHAGRLLE